MKKILGVVMVLVMLFGNCLSVLAMDYTIDQIPTSGRMLVKNGDAVKMGNNSGNIYVFTNGVEANSSATHVPITGDYYARSEARAGGGYNLYLTTASTPGTNPGGSGQGAKEPKAIMVEAEQESVVTPEKEEKVHYHDFQWLITKDPTPEEDGLAQNICTCGEVDAEQPVSSAFAFVNMVRDAIETAPEGGTVVITSELYTCYTAKIMKALSIRPDVSLKTTFLAEDGTWQTFIIPAGGAVMNEEQFYGFNYLGNLYGWEE